MKIGVMTVHQSISAGGSLQAYALCNELSRLGHEVEVINYCPYYFMDFTDYSNRKLRSTPRGFAKWILNGKTLKAHRRLFDEFQEECLPKRTRRFDDHDTLQAACLEYDAYVCGSDQIWNPPHVHYDNSWFFDFASDRGRKISYAASIGKDRLDSKDLEWLKAGASQLDFVSVREDTAVKVMSSIGVEATQCIDPTFLMSPESWRQLERKPAQEIPKDYVFYYTVASGNPLELALLDRVKSRTGCPCVMSSTAFRKPNCADVQVKQCGPREFLYLVNHAKYVYTNSFHGLVFSILFGKRVISFKNMTTNSRLSSLLRLLGLEGFQLSELSEFDNMDWGYVDEALVGALARTELPIADSKAFLKRSLS